MMIDFSDPFNVDGVDEYDAAGIDRETKRLAAPGARMPAVFPPDSKRSRHPIQYFRQHLGLGAPEFARLIGAPVSTVVAWEQKPHRPAPTKWEHLDAMVQLARRNKYYFSLQQMYDYCAKRNTRQKKR